MRLTGNVLRRNGVGPILQADVILEAERQYRQLRAFLTEQGATL